jgi:hypothetical protein
MQRVTEKPSGFGRRARSGDEPPEELQDRLAELLPADALQDALKGLDPDEITGSGGLLSQLAGRVINAALEGELTGHLRRRPAGAGTSATGRPRRRSRPISGRSM